jgi:hypothetical protein
MPCYLFATIISVIFLSGCSLQSLIYSQADRVAMYKIDDLFDLNSDQDELISKKVTETIDEAKKTSLPKFRRFLIDLSVMAIDGIDKDEYEIMAKDLKVFRKDVFEIVRPIALVLFSSLNPKQIIHFKEELEATNDDLIELLAFDSINEFEEDYMELKLKNYINWYGEFSEEQLIKFKMIYQATPHKIKTYLKRRRFAQLSVIKFLQTSPSSSDIKVLFTQWRDEPHVIRGFKSRQDEIESRKSSRKVFLAIQGLLTQEQFRTFDRKLKDIILLISH